MSVRKQDYKHALECLDEISVQVAETAVIITHTQANLFRIWVANHQMITSNLGQHAHREN